MTVDRIWLEDPAPTHIVESAERLLADRLEAVLAESDEAALALANSLLEEVRLLVGGSER